MARSFGYSRWDGTQVGFELDADAVMNDISDDVLYHGDLHAALRRLVQSGMPERGLAGTRQLLDDLRRRRQEELARHDLGGAHQEVARALREVVGTERAALDQMSDEMAADRRLHLDLLPPDLAGRVRALQQHDFASSQALERFEALLDELRSELVQSQFNRMSGALADLGPDELARLGEMLTDLNRLLEMRAAGEPTDEAFARFMQRHGELLPGAPRSLEELLEYLAAQMAAAEAMLSSMTPEQRSQLRALSEQLLADLGLQWQLDQLRHNLRQAVPAAGWDRAYSFGGQGPLGLLEGAEVLDRLGQLDDLEGLLRSATAPGALSEVDLDRVRELLGDDAARSVDRLAEVSRMLADAGLVEHREGRLELTPRGLRRLGHNALADLFTRLSKDRLGRHRADVPGPGHERSDNTKPYEFGDPFNLDIERTVRNALSRRGGGTPVRLSAQDFEVARTEALTRTSTVVMLDLSLSMPMRDNFLAAKKVAMALHSLISTQYPRDYLALVGFSEVAREMMPSELPELSWDFTSGTNVHHALVLARRLLARQPGTRQVIMITDGEPTAHVTAQGGVFFHYPPARETVDATLTEVARCTREGIRINTFMLDATPYLKAFVDELTRLNRGRAFFTTPDTLGDYVLVDFLEQKRSRRTAS